MVENQLNSVLIEGVIKGYSKSKHLRIELENTKEESKKQTIKVKAPGSVKIIYVGGVKVNKMGAIGRVVGSLLEDGVVYAEHIEIRERLNS